MFKLKTQSEQSFLVIKNQNDTLDFISSIQYEINKLLTDNNEKLVKQVKINYGASKKTSEQQSEEYQGVKAFATLIKKSISAGNQGYFTGNRDRWKYTMVDKDSTRYFKNFDNHIKINFKCKTALERETLKTIILILLTFFQYKLKCSVCDLDYIEDVEVIKDELFEFNVYIYARTVLKFEYENTQVSLEIVEHNSGIKDGKEELETYENKEESEDNFNGFI